MSISDIDITNLTSKVINPFIRFTIGGDYTIETLVLGDGSKKYLHSGSPGPMKISDVVSYVEPNKNKPFRMSIKTEVTQSYESLSREHFHIEVWDKAAWSLNTFLGYESLLLQDVARGTIKQSVKIFDKTEKNGVSTQQICDLNFMLHFEEVWDFELAFLEFKATDLTHRKSSEAKKRKKIKPII